jgi:hypothetical protein
MRYTVVWRETALQQLADIWIQATDREAVNQRSMMWMPSWPTTPIKKAKTTSETATFLTP